MKKHYLLFMAQLTLGILLAGCSTNTRFVTGSFTRDGENGINILELNSKSGIIGKVSTFNAGPNPSYLCIDKQRKIIYALNEVNEFMGQNSGGITAVGYENEFENLKKIGELPVPNGGPCYITLSPDRNFLLLANYGGGSVAVVKLNNDGTPGEVTDTIIYNGTGSKVSHAHMIDFDPQGEKVYVTDLGLDRMMIYNFDTKSGKLVPVDETGVPLSPFSGPRHFVFNREGSMLYVMGELSSAITVFRIDQLRGPLVMQIIPSINESYNGKNSSADIHISVDGRFLYCSNRGENSIATFRIGQDGLLQRTGITGCGGNWPRNFNTDPAGKFILVANQKSDNIAVFKINSKTGLPSDSLYSINIKAPACIKY